MRGGRKVRSRKKKLLTSNIRTTDMVGKLRTRRYPSNIYIKRLDKISIKSETLQKKLLLSFSYGDKIIRTSFLFFGRYIGRKSTQCSCLNIINMA